MQSPPGQPCRGRAACWLPSSHLTGSRGSSQRMKIPSELNFSSEKYWDRCPFFFLYFLAVLLRYYYMALFLFCFCFSLLVVVLVCFLFFWGVCFFFSIFLFGTLLIIGMDSFNLTQGYRLKSMGIC